MSLSAYLRGTVRVECVCADPGGALSAWAERGLRFWDPVLTEPLTLQADLNRRDLQKLEALSARRGDSLRILGCRGLWWDLGAFFRRPGLVLGLVLLILMMTALPKRVWFLKFEGNTTVSDARLAAAAQECGLSFFVRVPEIKSEEFKNKLVNLLPEIGWAGVEFRGGIATVTVREQEIRPQIRDRRTPANVVAARDGIITSMNVLGGQALCRVGQGVLQGELLVSGLIDCEIHTQVTQADAEIYALTQRPLTVVTPQIWVEKGETTEKTWSLSLILGKTRIKICGKSGILPPTYDKIRTVKMLTLPGGYALPLGISLERGVLRESENREQMPPEEELKSSGRAYLTDQMLAGRILDARETVFQDGDRYVLEGIYTCNEMIARQKAVELIEGDAKDD